MTFEHTYQVKFDDIVEQFITSPESLDKWIMSELNYTVLNALHKNNQLKVDRSTETKAREKQTNNQTHIDDSRPDQVHSPIRSELRYYV